MYRFRLALFPVVFLPQVWAQTCETFGVDFQDGNTYFQNSLSTDSFTFVSRFEGCENGTADNQLVGPTGALYYCSTTRLQPDDTPQLSTCPISKANLVSGLWSMHVISNNGKGDPVAYQRNVSLNVGPQSTTTYTPTVTLPVTVTPLVNITSTGTFNSTTVLPPATVTSPSTTLNPTVTVTPPPVTTTKTVTLSTLTIRKPTLSIKQVTSTNTATCITPTKQLTADPTLIITSTAITAPALETSAAGAKFRRNLGRRVPLDQEQRPRERAERFVEKRAPDFPTITVTDTNTADFVTVTSAITAPAQTITVISTITTVATSTPPPVTVFSGISSSAVVTVTAPVVTKTRTNTKLFGFVTETVTVTRTVTIQTTITPTGLTASCTSIGGRLS